MALTTLGEAGAVNMLTTHLLGRHATPYSGRPLPTDQDVLAALHVLVRASYSKLAAGWSPQQLEEAGPLRPADQPEPHTPVRPARQ